VAAVDTDNLVGDFIVNTGIVLEENAAILRLKKVYKEDVALVDVFPSVAISANNITLERKSLGSIQARFEIDIAGEIWYYHEKLVADTRKNEVMRAAWEVCEVLQKNATLNKWVSSTRAYVRACTWTLRRSGDVILASARILLVARVQHRFTIV